MELDLFSDSELFVVEVDVFLSLCVELLPLLIVVLELLFVLELELEVSLLFVLSLLLELVVFDRLLEPDPDSEVLILPD